MLENFFETLVDEEEYICGNKFIDISDGINIIFSKIDNVSEFYQKNIDVFITHNGDFSLDEKKYKVGPNYKKWFAQNKLIDKTNVYNIPIGLENFEPEFSYKSKFGKFSSLPINGPAKKNFIVEMSKNFNEHKNLVYMNFNTTTYPSERNVLKKKFMNEEWVLKEEDISWKQYYISLMNSKFCFSPRGNGIDCHRTWEALYLRTIPIIKREGFMNEFSDLPILFIDSWDEISEEYLLKKYEEMSKITYNLEKLKISYWREKICQS